jgi:carbonic anhydrase
MLTTFSDLDELREVSERFFEEDVGVEERDRRLVELNVLAQVHWVTQQASVMKAIRERGMKVHGFVYNSAQRSCVELEIISQANTP